MGSRYPYSGRIGLQVGYEVGCLLYRGQIGVLIGIVGGRGG